MVILMRGIALLLWAHGCLGNPDWTHGAPECPCINSTSAFYEQLRSELVAAGLDADYGTLGCAAYDVNRTTDGCESNTGAHCFNPWCFIDTAAWLFSSTFHLWNPWCCWR